jgi:hypothetical protein
MGWRVCGWRGDGSDSPPPCGEGLGEGCRHRFGFLSRWMYQRRRARSEQGWIALPSPNPSPQGGGESGQGWCSHFVLDNSEAIVDLTY